MAKRWKVKEEGGKGRFSTFRSASQGPYICTSTSSPDDICILSSDIVQSDLQQSMM